MILQTGTKKRFFLRQWVFLRQLGDTYVQKCRHWRKWLFWRNFASQPDDFYANYIIRNGPNMLANLTILAIFMQITSAEVSLTCWRIWRIWRFLCKLHRQRWVLRVGEFGEFGDFYANYITRDGSNVLANLTILAILIASWVEQKAMYSSLVLITLLPKWN